MPHHAVIRDEAESTKMRIVYDCSAKADRNSPSLNDCLDPGPPLQNKLWNVLVRGRFHPVCLTGDIRKAFLQVRIRDGDRDALRFHWLKSLDSNEVETYRFTRALLDSGASHSYASSTLIEQIKARPVKTSTRRIATLMSTTTTKVEEYDLSLEAILRKFVLNARVTKINKRELLTLDNPNYERVLSEYQHLRGVTIDDMTDDRKLPVHLIICANEYAKIRTQTQARVGRQGEPVAELTRFGWAIMAPGDGADLKTGFLAVNTTTDYDRLCTLDVLGLEDSPPPAIRGRSTRNFVSS